MAITSFFMSFWFFFNNFLNDFFIFNTDKKKFIFIFYSTPSFYINRFIGHMFFLRKHILQSKSSAVLTCRFLSHRLFKYAGILSLHPIRLTHDSRNCAQLLLAPISVPLSLIFWLHIPRVSPSSFHCITIISIYKVILKLYLTITIQSS